MKLHVSDINFLLEFSIQGTRGREFPVSGQLTKQEISHSFFGLHPYQTLTPQGE